MPITIVVLTGVLVAFIIFVSIFIIKNLASPQKLDTIKKLIKEGKYQNAQRVAKQIIAKNPRDWTAHYLLGKAYLADNKKELAFIEFKTVNQNAVFNGDIPELEFRKQMATLYSQFNQQEEALKEYLLLTNMEPANAENDFNVGQIYEQMGKYPLAMGFYQKAITANKKHAKAYASIGYLLFRSKQYNDAKKAIDMAIKLNPEAYSNYYYLGKILKEVKDYSAACKALEKATRDPSFKQKALIERGSCLMMAGMVDQAAGDFDRAVKSAKDEDSQETLYARYFLAACYEKNRKIEKALEQWEIIFKKNKQFKDVGNKLNQYKALQANDNMKEYLTSGGPQFMDMCKKLALAIGMESQKIEPTKYGCSMLATEAKKDNWMNQRQQVYSLDFYRVTDPLEDSVVRKVVDKVKLQGYIKGIIITNTEFTHSAIAYSENRSVVLMAKEQLEAIFKKANL